MENCVEVRLARRGRGLGNNNSFNYRASSWPHSAHSLTSTHRQHRQHTLMTHTVRLPCVFGQMTNCWRSSSSSRAGFKASKWQRATVMAKPTCNLQLATAAAAAAAETATEVDLNALQNAVKLF